MVSVVIPTLNAGATLSATLGALVPAAVAGVVRQVVVADGGSSDATLAIAEQAGALIVRASAGRGLQLGAGAAAATTDWLVFLHADTVLEAGFEAELAAFCDATGGFAGLGFDRAAAFRFALNDTGASARLLTLAVALRCRLLRLPYGDQGLVISRRFYDRLGGYKPLPLMEDVDLVRRIGAGNLTLLNARAVTSAARYRQAGYVNRTVRNALCLGLYFVGMSPQRIARIYG